MQSRLEHHTYSGFEPLQAFDVVFGGHFEHRLVSPQRATMVHRRLTLDDVRVETGAYDFPVIAQGAMPEGAVCIGFVADGVGATRYNTEIARRDAIQVYASGAELLYHAVGASRWINFTAARSRLQDVAIARTGRPLLLPKRGIATIPVDPSRREHLKMLVDDALALAMSLQPAGIGSELGQEVARALVTAYVDAIVHADLTRLPSGSTANRHHEVILTCERMVMAAGPVDFDLSEVARRTGYSLRSLERVFHAAVGTTPGRWFRTIRLNGALRDLLAPKPGCSVTEVATKWGFRHLSRFSDLYRRAFGEFPSQTLSRSRKT